MANHSWIVFRKNVDLAALEGHLQAYNARRFGSCLKINRDEYGICVKTPEGRRLDFWRESKRKLEWAHPIGGDVAWWISFTLASYMARQIQADCKIHDDGIDEKMEPDFDLKYPTIADWVSGKYLSMFTPSTHPERSSSSPIYWVNPL